MTQTLPTPPGDLLVRRGLVVDGTGADARPADVRIRRKEVVERDECADGVIQNASIPDADDQLFG